MKHPQLTALEYPCRFGFETAHPRFCTVALDGRTSLVLSVNSGYE